MFTFIINNMIEFKEAMGLIYEHYVDVEIVRRPGGMIKSIIVSAKEDDEEDDFYLLELWLSWTSESGWYPLGSICPICAAKGIENHCGHYTFGKNPNQKLYWEES